MYIKKAPRALVFWLIENFTLFFAFLFLLPAFFVSSGVSLITTGSIYIDRSSESTSRLLILVGIYDL